MPPKEAPYRKEITTLRAIQDDPRFAKGWYVKVTDEEGPFIIPTSMFFSQYSEELDEEQTAYFSEIETVVLLWTGYSFSPMITLLHWTAALDYLYCSDKLVG